MNAVEVFGLSKQFASGHFAVKDVSIMIEKGDIFGFLGPNGAGKTTTIRLLNGILDPTAGSGKVLGYDMVTQRKEIHLVSGVMTESAGLYEHLSAFENMVFFAKLFNMSYQEAKNRAESLLDLMELSEHRTKKVKNFSTGMRRRLLIARALIHEPKILFLDEPTSGLDPEAAFQVNQMILHMAKEKQVTVFMCTHQLKYAEGLCNRYGFIHQGSILGSGTFEDLLKERGAETFAEVVLKDKLDKPVAFEGIIEVNPLCYKALIKDHHSLNPIINAIIDAGGNIVSATQTTWSLEDLYFDFQKEVNSL